jgi:hypothetical protein
MLRVVEEIEDSIQGLFRVVEHVRERATLPILKKILPREPNLGHRFHSSIHRLRLEIQKLRVRILNMQVLYLQLCVSARRFRAFLPRDSSR